MRVVVVDGDISYPATSGKRLRTVNLMVRLAQHHRVTYIARGDAPLAERKAAESYFRDHGVEPILLDLPLPKKSGPAFYARLGLNVLSSWPYSVTSHQSLILREVVTRYALEHPVDLWQFEWSAYLPCLEERILAPRLLIAHNVDTLIWQRYHDTAKGLLKREFLRQQWRKFERFEKFAFSRANRVVAVSPEDALLIRTRFGQPAVDVVDNGIDREYFEKVQPRPDRRKILFLGALDWRPNLDGIELLLDRIFPEIVKQEPEAKLVVVGRNPPAGLVERIKNTPGIELHANVPDVRPFLAEAGVMAVPLRIGGGSRLKILEALAAGLPVVSTRVGAEGLNLTPGVDFTAAEETHLAAALVDAIRQPERQQALARHGRDLVLAQYDWDVLAGKLEQSWERCVRSFGARHLDLPNVNTFRAPANEVTCR